VTEAVVVGAANRDVFFALERVPAAGETLIGTHYVADGGKGANQAVQAAILGVDTALVGCVGEDDAGAEVLGGLAEAGVETRHVCRLDGAGTGMACIWLTAGGEKRIVVSPGANSSLRDRDLDAVAPVIAEAGLLLAQLEVPHEAVRRAVELASRSGVLVVVNAAPANLMATELLGWTDVLIVNRSECGVLSSRPVDTDAAVDEAARALCALGAGTTIVTLGGRGARVVDADGCTGVERVAVDVIDPTGAGDAFCGAAAAALVRGLSPLDAARVGALAGALCATRRGARPSKEDAPRVLAELAALAADGPR